MKRKDLEFDRVYDLSPPSTKSRRLDCELLPVMYPEVRDRVLSQQQQQHLKSSTTLMSVDTVPPPPNVSEERALVVYNPANIPIPKCPTTPDFFIILNSDSVPGLKDLIYWQGNSKPVKSVRVTGISNDCMAVVPWVASNSQLPEGIGAVGLTSDLSDPMETEVEMMDTEDINVSNSAGKVFELCGVVDGNGGLHDWQQQQQQHCMTPQLLQNTHTAVTW